MSVSAVRLVAGLMLTATFAFTLPRAEAYRPFISTDAAVADPKELEIELGYFTFRRERRENTFLIPTAVLNYGFWRNLELVGEFRVARAPSGDVDVVDPAVFVKGGDQGGSAPRARRGRCRDRKSRPASPLASACHLPTPGTAW